MSLILSIDDGCASDIRIAELADRFGIETIFYWPVEWHSLAYNKGYTPLNYTDAEQIAKNFEIGSHTITHRHLTSIPIEEAKKEITDSKYMLEDLFRCDIKKFCPPRGYTNNELTEHTYLHYETQRLTKGAGLVHIHPNSGANSNVHWRDYYEQYKDTITEAWLHSWELDRYPEEWENLEKWLKEITGKDCR